MEKLAGWNNLGGIYYRQQDWQGAIVCYQETITIDPHFKEGYHNLGLALRANNELESAIHAYHQALALDPNYASAHQNLAVAYLKQGRLPEAHHAFSQAITLYRQQGQHHTAQQLELALAQQNLSPSVTIPNNQTE